MFMNFSPLTQRLDSDERFVLKKGHLCVEKVKKHDQRSCFSKFVHRKQNNPEKILTALQSLYSSSLSPDEVKNLKKNIRATLQHAAKENVKAAQMGSFSRWLFNKHIVDLKPYTQTFEILQSTTFQPKLLQRKFEYNLLPNQLEDLHNETDLNKALKEIAFINVFIQKDIKTLKTLKQPHRPAHDITELNNAENHYKALQEKLEKECGKRDKQAIKHTNTLTKEAKKHANAKSLKKCIKELEAHRNAIETCKKKLGGSLQVSFTSLHHTEKAIKKCQKTLEALETQPVYQQEIKEILDKVKQFPQNTQFDKQYLDKANACLDEAKHALEKMQKTLKPTSATYQQIQEELLDLKESREDLKKCIPLGQIIDLINDMKIKYTNLKDFLLKDTMTFSVGEKILQKYSDPNPQIKYDFIAKHAKEHTKIFVIEYENYKKSFDFDQYVADTITTKQSQLIAKLKSKYSVDADFTKNTHAIKEIAKSISETFDIDSYLSQIYSGSHPLYKKLVTILEEKKIASQKELFKPFEKAILDTPLTPGDDLPTLISNWQKLKTIKKQNKHLKVCDPNGFLKKFLPMQIQAIEEKISTIFSDRIKEIKALSDEFIEKFDVKHLPPTPNMSEQEREIYLKTREETLEKMKTIANEHKSYSILFLIPFEIEMEKIINVFDLKTIW